MSLIIGFGRRSGVGKSFACHVVKQQFATLYPKIDVKIYDLATPMKDMAHRLWGRLGVMPAEHYERYREDRSKVIEGLGCNVTELWCKLVDPLCLIEPGLPVNAMLRASLACDILLLPNIRRPAEANAVKNCGGMLFEIEADAPIQEGAKFDATLEGYSGWDDSLWNDKTESFRSVLLDNVVIPAIDRLGDSLSGKEFADHHPV